MDNLTATVNAGHEITKYFNVNLALRVTEPTVFENVTEFGAHVDIVVTGVEQS